MTESFKSVTTVPCDALRAINYDLLDLMGQFLSHWRYLQDTMRGSLAEHDAENLVLVLLNKILKKTEVNRINFYGGASDGCQTTDMMN